MQQKIAKNRARGGEKSNKNQFYRPTGTWGGRDGED